MTPSLHDTTDTLRMQGQTISAGARPMAHYSDVATKDAKSRKTRKPQVGKQETLFRVFRVFRAFRGARGTRQRLL